MILFHLFLSEFYVKYFCRSDCSSAIKHDCIIVKCESCVYYVCVVLALICADSIMIWYNSRKKDANKSDWMKFFMFFSDIFIVFISHVQFFIIFDAFAVFIILTLMQTSLEEKHIKKEKKKQQCVNEFCERCSWNKWIQRSESSLNWNMLEMFAYTIWIWTFLMLLHTNLFKTL